MKTAIKIVCSVAIIVLSATIQAQETLPEVTIKNLDGSAVELSDQLHEEGYTILCFWATWCAPCKKELDAIADIYEDWTDAYPVKLLAISTDDARALPKVKPMALEKDWPFEVLTDSNQELMRALQFQTIPQSFIVNADGEIVYSHSGYLPGDEDDMEEKLAELSE